MEPVADAVVSESDSRPLLDRSNGTGAGTNSHPHTTEVRMYEGDVEAGSGRGVGGMGDGDDVDEGDDFVLPPPARWQQQLRAMMWRQWLFKVRIVTI